MAGFSSTTLYKFDDPVMGERPLRVVEFYSGIGGMRQAIKSVLGPSEYTIVAAYDNNNTANETYEYYFDHTPIRRSLEHVTVEELDSHRADIWVMSPPCQPYTRGGKGEGANDTRAKSAHHLFRSLQQMKNPPKRILVENVRGFEDSATHGLLMESLKEMKFHVCEFLLTPTQFQIPNERSRYYCLARKEQPFPTSSEQGILGTIPDHPTCVPVDSAEQTRGYAAETQDLGHIATCRPLQQYLEVDMPSDELKNLEIPLETRQKLQEKGYRWDILRPTSQTSTCITKGYGQNILRSPVVEISSEPKASDGHRLRFLSPREVSNLMYFPKDFTFPPHLSTKKRWALLGNSVNVHVVAQLLRHLLELGFA